MDVPQANSRFTVDSEELPRELVDLGKRIKQMPASIQEELGEPYAKVIESVRRRRRILTLVQDALAQLRLDIKYLVFDRDITRIERDQLQNLLDEDE